MSEFPISKGLIVFFVGGGGGGEKIKRNKEKRIQKFDCFLGGKKEYKKKPNIENTLTKWACGPGQQGPYALKLVHS